MSRILIEDVKIKRPEYPTWCPSNVYALKYSIDGKSRWFYIDLGDGGFVNFFDSEKDVTDNLYDISEMDDFESEEYKALLSEREELSIDEFCGVSLHSDLEYPDIIKYILELEGNETISFLKYAFALMICEDDDENGLMEYGKGKYSDEIYVPLSSMTKD